VRIHPGSSLRFDPGRSVIARLTQPPAASLHRSVRALLPSSRSFELAESTRRTQRRFLLPSWHSGSRNTSAASLRHLSAASLDNKKKPASERCDASIGDRERTARCGPVRTVAFSVLSACPV